MVHPSSPSGPLSPSSVSDASSPPDSGSSRSSASPQPSGVPDSPDPAPVVAELRSAGCVFAEDEARLLLEAAANGGVLASMLARRVAGEPLESILGWAEFAGLRIAVEAGVFVPRRRSAVLAAEAISLARRAGGAEPAASRPGDLHGDNLRPIVVDLCCGSGALGAAMLAALPGLELYATDVDPVATRCARRNLAARGGRVHTGDLYDPLPRALLGRIDVLVANAPYVPTDAVKLMPPEARLHEPLATLDGGPDGLDVLRRIIAGAPEWLADGGHLLFETSEDQAPDAARVVASSGLVPRVVSDPDQAATVVVGRLGPA
jgi:release factor glutamine methyltransferase